MKDWRQGSIDYATVLPAAVSDPERWRHCALDLVALSALRATWRDCEPSWIAKSVASPLISMLGAEFAYIGLYQTIDVAKAPTRMKPSTIDAIPAVVEQIQHGDADELSGATFSFTLPTVPTEGGLNA